MVAKKNLCVLILAGGQGTRMKSALPKVLHKVCGAPLISHILREVSLLKPAAIGILTGHKSAFVKETIKENLSAWGIKTPVEFMVQKNLTGSGTAV
ncbi:MAG: NTP transferase domain-containing protein, partial [Campylobacter sp.]|nr:NTP transferase domain-containing protein [Campylobacter sp.]